MNKIKPTVVKAQALQCSKHLRANKFRRVSADFLEQVEADVDAYLRKLFGELHTADDPIAPCGKLFTPAAQERLLDILNAKVATIVQNRVKCHPSIGKTLQG